MLRPVTGTPRHYDWGDTESIPKLFGLDPDGRPWAEMWFGTHHLAPSHLDRPDGPALSDVVGEMEMLVKILAAARPLSLQTHPTIAQAIDGYEREERAGIAITAFERMYKDRSDKPEILVALTDFEALCGFKPASESVTMFESMGWHDEAEVLASGGIEHYLAWSFARTDQPSLDRCPPWLTQVARLHPSDPGLRVAPLLHHVVLRPGQALSLPAGNLHAYLSGCGLEVMNSSDNVVRAGFTSKHIDVAELLAILDTTPMADPVSDPDSDGRYPTPSEAFTVSRIDIDGPVRFDPIDQHRIVFGPFTTIEAATKPGMFLLAAGEHGVLESAAVGSVWVCTQR